MIDNTSNFYDGKIEGVYIRIIKGDFLENRYKIVRSDFINDPTKHWTDGGYVFNNFEHF